MSFIYHLTLNDAAKYRAECAHLWISLHNNYVETEFVAVMLTVAGYTATSQ